MLLARLHLNDPNHLPTWKPDPRLAPAYRTYRQHVATLAAGGALLPIDERELDAAAMAVGLDREDIEADVDALHRTRELEARAEAMDDRRPELLAEYESAGAELAEAQARLTAAKHAFANAKARLHGLPHARQMLRHHRAQHPHLYARLGDE